MIDFKPRAWQRAKLSYLVTELGGSTPSKDRPEFWNGTVPWVSPKDMKVDCIRDSIDHVTKRALAETNLRTVPVGSVLMVVRGMILAHSVPVALSGVPVTLNQDMKALVPGPRVSGLFLRYCLQAHQARLLALVEEAGHGTRCLRSELWRKFELAIPPLATQLAIANFLDRKTAAIDALIEKKRKLLDLLAEKRAALINQAVTKGLDPDVPMKDSGIPWIGVIPVHWEVAPLYSRFAVQLGKMLDASRVTGNSLAPYLRNANVQWDHIDIVDLNEMDFGPADRKKFALKQGDILMCEGGANAKVVGRSAIWNGEIENCYYQKALHRIRALSSDEVPRFLLYAIQAACEMGVFVAGSNANIFHLPAEQLRVFRFAFPPTAEQRVIVSRLDAAQVASRRTSELLSRNIERLQEYRQSLITAAVTGQLDISAEAGRWPRAFTPSTPSSPRSRPTSSPTATSLPPPQSSTASAHFFRES